ncbi:MAG: hypothetical protein ABSC60_03150 [Acidobacteriota bacterium]|jgi:hypothetical protein
MGKNEVLRAAGDFFGRLEAEATDPSQANRRHWTVLLLSMGLSAWAAVHLGQDVSWDVQNYHFYAGYAFLHKPFLFDFAPAQVQSFFNPLLHLVSYLLLEHVQAWVAAALLGAFQGVNFYLIFQISESLFQRWDSPYRHLVSLGSGAAGFYGTVNIMELGATFGDNLVSVVALAGLLCVIRYLQSGDEARKSSVKRLWIGGACIGVAFALKLTVIIYVAALTLAAAAVFLGRDRRLRPLIAFYCGIAAGFLAAYGIWGFNLYREYLNPVYPYLNNIFRSPYYDLHNAMDSRFMPRNWQETWFYPFFFVKKNHLASEIEFRDARLACCYVATVLLAALGLFRLAMSFRKRAVRRGMPSEHWCLLLLAVLFPISYMAWQYIFSVYRYLAILEVLAPTFLALTLTAFFRRRWMILGLSLAINFSIIGGVIPPSFGRKAFDDEFLRVEIPQIQDMDRSVVLMAGEEATAYIVPRFPSSTRFVRIVSNFVFPGRNAKLDEQIRSILAPYDAAHQLVYLANAREMASTRQATAYYGVTLNDQACREVRSRAGNRGFLCATLGTPNMGEPATAPVQFPASSPQPESEPVFQKLEQVRLEVSPEEAVAGKDTIQYRVIGLETRKIDMMFTLDGKEMPPARNWELDDRNSVRIFVSDTTRKGMYHIIGIRDSALPDRNRWIEVDVRARIK